MKVIKRFYNKKRGFVIQAGCLSLCLALSTALVPTVSQATERVFYRYINDKGVKVMTHTIPPEYAQKGYEVVHSSGKVIKVVAPAISREEAAKRNAERAEAERLAEWDAKLTRRYSRVADIEAAKQRKLQELEGNITILEGNLRGLKTQIGQQQARAADSERAGRQVPEAVINTINALEEEVVITESQIALRREEYNEVADRFDRDIERFRVIRPGS
jgi:chromosome segregation ATPase